MKRIFAILNFVLGFVMLLICFAAFTSIPMTLGHTVTEPEDFYGALFFGLFAALYAATSFNGGKVLLTEKSQLSLIRRRATVGSCLTLLTFSFFIAGIGLLYPEGSDFLFYLLFWIPVVLFSMTCFLFMRDDVHP